jgi:hypothetical protein
MLLAGVRGVSLASAWRRPSEMAPMPSMGVDLTSPEIIANPLVQSLVDSYVENSRDTPQTPIDAS